MKHFLQRKEVMISRVAMMIIFLALIRTIAECFRLQYNSTSTLTFIQLKPFLMGALTAAIACLMMTILSFYSKHKIIIAVAILTIIALLIIKSIYL